MQAAKVIVWIVFAICLFMGVHAYRQLCKENELLTERVESLNMALSAVVERSSRVEEATQRLVSNEQERQTRLQRFERKLGSLATENEDVRRVLAVVVPVELVHGLRAFPETH